MLQTSNGRKAGTRTICSLIIVAAAWAVFWGCEPETLPVSATQKSDALARIEQNSMPDFTDWSFEQTQGGVRYVELSAGSGENAWYGDEVRVNYVLWDPDGRVMDESRPDGIGFHFSFDVGEGNVIEGWDELILEMNTGSKVLAIVPWRLGYGRRGRWDIPGRTDLVFYVELVRITR
jgi:FKBP-type peptidyl-prolyl cis-trans isomerase